MEYSREFKLANGSALVEASIRMLELPEAEALATDGELPKHWDLEQTLWLCEFTVNRIPAGRFFRKPGSLGLDMHDPDDVLRHCLGLAKDKGVTT